MLTMSGDIGRVVLIILVGGATGLACLREARGQCPAGTLVARNSNEGDRFGIAATMDGNWLAIGAASGDGRVADTGAVYVYDLRSVAPWGRIRERFEITAPDGDRNDGFFRVALAGNHLVVGASGDDDFGSGSGAVYAFEYDGVGWVLNQKLTAKDAMHFAGFGNAVAIWESVILIGASSDDEFGSGAGAGYVFHNANGAWSQVTKIAAGDTDGRDGLGSAVALEADYAVLGAQENEVSGVQTGSAYVFHREGTEWVEEARLVADDGMDGDMFGAEVGVSGEFVAVGAPFHADGREASGAVYVFRREGAKWTEVAKVQASPRLSRAQFGQSVVIRGDRLLVGAPGGGDGGSAFLFERSGDAYVQIQRFWTPPIFDGLGTAVGFAGEHVVVGAEDANLGAGIWSGAAYLYRLGAEGPLDIRDYARFQACYTGPGSRNLSDCCALLDYDHDRDVDHDDYDGFIARFTGP